MAGRNEDVNNSEKWMYTRDIPDKGLRGFEGSNTIYNFINLSTLFFHSFNKSEPRYTPRILGRRFALTVTAYKYLDIGISVGSTSFVELILGDNRGNQIVLPWTTWTTIIERRMDIEQLMQSTVGSSLCIQDHLIIELVKMRDANIVKVTLRDPATSLYMIPTTVLFLFEIEQCVEHVYFNLCQDIQHVNTKYKNFVTILRQNRITDKCQARKVLSEVSDGSSLIECELLAYGLDNIVYEAKIFVIFEEINILKSHLDDYHDINEYSGCKEKTRDNNAGLIQQYVDERNYAGLSSYHDNTHPQSFENQEGQQRSNCSGQQGFKSYDTLLYFIDDLPDDIFMEYQ
ncbi:uncharacterized protein [Temnothorax longispinosus]|uniref:uncharacterized protein n=1 Tax=Temnothorax longispinosus TaxID=300112 RepID=UPI003A98F544